VKFWESYCGYKVVVFHTEKSQPHKMHIWFFADTQANSKKPKEHFLANAHRMK